MCVLCCFFIGSLPSAVSVCVRWKFKEKIEYFIFDQFGTPIAHYQHKLGQNEMKREKIS